MTQKIRPLWFYGIITVLTAAVWFSLMEFARLPTGIHKGIVSTLFVSTLFTPYVFLVFAVCCWYEAKRNKRKH
jgi:hypothetical protein